MKIDIRFEDTKDYRKVEEVARDAFWNLYVPGAQEHYIIHNMRNHMDYIKELSFIIELEGEIVGAIFYTHSKIIATEDKEYKTISFGPVFISPTHHRKGLGRKLITHSIAIAKKLGHQAIITTGYPYHYETYGFSGGKKYNISMEDGKYYKGLLVLPLVDGALDNISGKVVFSDVLDAIQEEVDEFDKSFSPKEKKYQKSQDEYEVSNRALE